MKQVLLFQKCLQALTFKVTLLMSLYLRFSITSETIFEAKKADITGIKM